MAIVKWQYFSFIQPPSQPSPKGRAERLKIALWAILANRPACRDGCPADRLLR